MSNKNNGLNWDNIESFSDCIFPEERKMIDDIVKEFNEDNQTKKCIFLGLDGNYFYYCGKGLIGEPPKELSPNNPIYKRKVDVSELQLHCFGSCETCCVYKGIMEK